MRLSLSHVSIVILLSITRLSLLFLSLLTHLFDILTGRLLVFIHEHINHVHRLILGDILLSLPILNVLRVVLSRLSRSIISLSLSFHLSLDGRRRWHRGRHLIQWYSWVFNYWINWHIIMLFDWFSSLVVEQHYVKSLINAFLEPNLVHKLVRRDRISIYIEPFELILVFLFVKHSVWHNYIYYIIDCC